MSAPLVPAEVDLQDFPFMPLHVARLRDSNLAAEEDPEACWYAVLLWAASWHQIPAGSLPDNDTVLMRLVGLGRDQRTWKKHRAGALRGFVLCEDGRLYHPVVAESALEAWNGKLRQRHRTFCAAIRQHNKRYPENTLETPMFEEWEALGRPDKMAEVVTHLSRVTGPNVTREKHSKRKGQGEGKGQGGSNIELPDGNSRQTDDFELELQGGEGLAPDAPLTADEVIEAWNKLARELGLPIVVKLTKARKVQLRQRIREHSFEDWTAALAAIRRSSFLHGSGPNAWRANFDFLLQPSSFVKLLEGHYDDQKQTG